MENSIYVYTTGISPWRIDVNTYNKPIHRGLEYKII
jgi:hypothetical protein